MSGKNEHEKLFARMTTSHTTPSIESHASLDENGNVHRESHLICSFKTKKKWQKSEIVGNTNEQTGDERTKRYHFCVVGFFLLFAAAASAAEQTKEIGNFQHNRNGLQFISISHKYRFRLSIDFSFFETIFFRSL